MNDHPPRNPAGDGAESPDSPRDPHELAKAARQLAWMRRLPARRLFRAVAACVAAISAVIFAAIGGDLFGVIWLSALAVALGIAAACVRRPDPELAVWRLLSAMAALPAERRIIAADGTQMLIARHRKLWRIQWTLGRMTSPGVLEIFMPMPDAGRVDRHFMAAPGGGPAASETPRLGLAARRWQREMVGRMAATGDELAPVIAQLRGARVDGTSD